jgi:pyridoxal 5'-phosphate synthase pdxT subunit
VKPGVLALQGAFREHVELLDGFDVEAVEVRVPDDLAGIDALILPGGESTTMSKLLVTSGLFEPIRGLLQDGMPVLATCAGLILIAHEVLDGRPDQLTFDRLDVGVRRNAYGSQLQSFEAPIDVPTLSGGAFPGVFIRAPVVERVGPDVEVLARHDEHPILVHSGSVWGATFHPELSGDLRIHQLFLEQQHQEEVQ